MEGYIFCNPGIMVTWETVINSVISFKMLRRLGQIKDRMITKAYLSIHLSEMANLLIDLGPVSISDKTSYMKFSRSLEAARFLFRLVRSHWNLTGTTAAVLPKCQSNFKAMRSFKRSISWLRDFTRSYDKTPYRILKRGPAVITLRS